MRIYQVHLLHTLLFRSFFSCCNLFVFTSMYASSRAEVSSRCCATLEAMADQSRMERGALVSVQHTCLAGRTGQTTKRFPGSLGPRARPGLSKFSATLDRSRIAREPGTRPIFPFPAFPSPTAVHRVSTLCFGGKRRLSSTRRAAPNRPPQKLSHAFSHMTRYALLHFGDRLGAHLRKSGG